MRESKKIKKPRPAYVVAGVAGTVAALGAVTLAATVHPTTIGWTTPAGTTTVAAGMSEAFAGEAVLRAEPTATSALTEEEKARLAAVQANADKHTVSITRPLQPADSSVVPQVTLTISHHGRRTLRLVTARGDLTGQRELAWVADHGHRVGSARCSQTIRLSPDVAPEYKPTLLICWHTGTRRSAYTVMVDLDGQPSARASVAAIDAARARLG